MGKSPPAPVAAVSPVVQPSVSTEGRRRTMAFRLAICRVPSARHVVTTAGRPSAAGAGAVWRHVCTGVGLRAAPGTCWGASE